MVVCARAVVCACVRLWARARVFCISVGKFSRVRACSTCARVCVERVCGYAPRRCARAVAARRGGAVYIDRPDPCGRPRAHSLRLVRSAGVARRRHLDEPHGQRGMGRAIWAHVGGRRRRRHLRHRRLPQRHLERRLGEHRRRCAGRTYSRGVVPGGYYRGTGVVLKGYYSGYYGYHRGYYSGLLQGVLTG